MTATALLKFTQNGHVGNSGRALIGTDAFAVQIANAVNADVQSYRVEMLYAPPDSPHSITPGVQSPTVLAEGDGVPAASFIPTVGVSGCYRIRLTVWSGLGFAGQSDVDIRNFGVPTPNKRLIKPPYQKFPDPLPLAGEGKAGEKPDELNFDDARWGWSGAQYLPGTYSFRLLNSALDSLDANTSGSPVLVDESTQGEATATPATGSYLFSSDGTTPGGVWVHLTPSNSSNFVEAHALALTRLAQGAATSGQFLSWDGNNWAPVAAPTGGLPDAETAGQITYWDGSAWTYNAGYTPTPGDIARWDGNSWAFDQFPRPDTKGQLLTAGASPFYPEWGLDGTPGTYGQVLYWRSDHWATTAAPGSNTVAYVPVMYNNLLSWEVFRPLPAAGYAGQLACWNGTAWTYSVKPTVGSYPYYTAGGTIDWATGGAGASLFTATTDGTVLAPISGYGLLGTDSLVAGGIWTRNIDDFLEPYRINVDKLYGGSTDYLVLQSYAFGGGVWSDTLQSLKTVSFAAEYDVGNSGTAATVDWKNGQKQRITLTGDCTLTFVAPTGPCSMTLKVIQDATGNRNITWPATARSSGGAIQIGKDVNKVTLVGVYYDGTNYYLASSVNIPATTATTSLV